MPVYYHNEVPHSSASASGQQQQQQHYHKYNGVRRLCRDPHCRGELPDRSYDIRSVTDAPNGVDAGNIDERSRNDQENNIDRHRTRRTRPNYPDRIPLDHDDRVRHSLSTISLSTATSNGSISSTSCLNGRYTSRNTITSAMIGYSNSTAGQYYNLGYQPSLVPLDARPAWSDLDRSLSQLLTPPNNTVGGASQALATDRRARLDHELSYVGAWDYN